jgi:RNA polymerase sigma factor (sigma-70 family)
MEKPKFTLTRAEEKILVKKYQETNDQIAFEKLLESSKNGIYMLVINNKGFLRHITEDDMYSELVISFEKAVRTFKLDRDIPLWTWAKFLLNQRLKQVSMSSVNKLCTWGNRGKFEDAESIPLEKVQEFLFADENTMQYSEKLDELISHIKPKYQSLIRKYFFERKSCADIGKEIGVTGQNVRLRLNRALSKLKSLCKEKGIENIKQYIDS